MPTYIKLGLLDPSPRRKEGNDYITPEVYVDQSIIQVLDDKDKLVLQFTYEELRGIIAIMSAEQEKKNLYMAASSKNN